MRFREETVVMRFRKRADGTYAATAIKDGVVVGRGKSDSDADTAKRRAGCAVMGISGDNAAAIEVSRLYGTVYHVRYDGKAGVT